MKKIKILFFVELILTLAVAFLLLILEILMLRGKICIPLLHSDIINYFIAFLSAFGTITLGIITIWQTENHKEKTDIRENANTERPFFIMKDLLAKNESNDEISVTYNTNAYFISSETDVKITIFLQNCGEGIAHNMMIYPLTPFGEAPGDCANRQTISPQSSHAHRIVTANINSELIYTIYYQNVIGFTYSQSFRIEIKHLSHGNNVSQMCIQNVTVEIFPLSHQLERPELQLKDGKFYNIKLQKHIEDFQQAIQDRSNL